jgi:hypothetical protein
VAGPGRPKRPIPVPARGFAAMVLGVIAALVAQPGGGGAGFAGPADAGGGCVLRQEHDGACRHSRRLDAFVAGVAQLKVTFGLSMAGVNSGYPRLVFWEPLG